MKSNHWILFRMRLCRVVYITYCFYAFSLQGFKKTGVNVSSAKKLCGRESSINLSIELKYFTGNAIRIATASSYLLKLLRLLLYICFFSSSSILLLLKKILLSRVATSAHFATFARMMRNLYSIVLFLLCRRVFIENKQIYG